MQYKLLFVFAALLVCSQALTIGESTGALYSINQKRYDDLIHRLKESGFSENKDTLLKTSITAFAFTCQQIAELITFYTFEDSRLDALDILKANIIDPQNKATIINSFTYITTKDEARKILDDLKPKSYLFGIPTGKVVFALDTSGSMSTKFKLSTGATLDRLSFVKKEFAKTVATFDNSTEFNILPYSSNVNPWRKTLQMGTQANITAALASVNSYRADGGTNIYAVLQAAWAIPNVDTIYLLTDGSPSVGVTDMNKIIADLKTWNAKTPIKVNTIAFLMGTEKWDDKPASRKLMSAIAEATNGIYRAIESDN